MNRPYERGSVVLMTAVLLPVLIFVLGLATDFGIMYAVRNSAQNAADAAAMAGVYEYACGSGGACPVGLSPYTNDTTGNTAAQNAFQANPFLGSSTATLTPTPGGYSCTDALGFQNYCYKVTVTTNSPTFFARVFGKQSVPISVTAVAQTNTGLGMGPSCVRPVFVPDTAIVSASQGYPAGCTYSSNTLSCPQGPIVLSNIRPTSPNSGTTFTPSTYYSLDFSSLLQDITDPANTPSNILNATNPVVYSDGTVIDNSGQGPNSPYAQSWYQCTVTALHCGQYVRVQTGLAPTTTTNSVNFLLAESNQYSTYIFPIWDATQTRVNGNEMFAKVVGWAQMSGLHCTNAGGGTDLPCLNGDKITATYMTYSACLGGGGTGGSASGSGSETGSYTTPVRLIRDGQ
jgi:Flp pilus assembly protein TadG